MLTNFSNVEVILTNITTGENIITATDTEGNVLFSNLPVGKYNVTIIKDGYGLKVGDPNNLINDANNANNLYNVLPWTIDVDINSVVSVNLTMVAMTQPFMDMNLVIESNFDGTNYNISFIGTLTVTPIDGLEVFFKYFFPDNPELNAQLTLVDGIYYGYGSFVFSRGNVYSTPFVSPSNTIGFAGKTVKIMFTTIPSNVTVKYKGVSDYLSDVILPNTLKMYNIGNIV